MERTERCGREHGWYRRDIRTATGSMKQALFATSLDSTWSIRLNVLLRVLTRQLFPFLCIVVSCTGRIFAIFADRFQASRCTQPGRASAIARVVAARSFAKGGARSFRARRNTRVRTRRVVHRAGVVKRSSKLRINPHSVRRHPLRPQPHKPRHKRPPKRSNPGKAYEEISR